VLGRVVLPKGKNIQPGESNYVQIRLEEPVYSSFRDRFVMRQYSPQITIGGGIILETNPVKFRKKYYDIFLQSSEAFARGNPEQRLQASFSAIKIVALTEKEIRIKIGLNENENIELISKMVKENQIFYSHHDKEKNYFSLKQIKIVEQKITTILNEFHQKFPGRLGKKLRELTSQISKKFPENLIQIVLKYGADEGIFQIRDDTITFKDYQIKLSSEQLTNLNKLEHIYLDAGFNPPTEKEALLELNISEKDFRENLNILLEQKKIIIVEPRLYFHMKIIDTSLIALRKYFKSNQVLRVSEFKELIKTSRKFALPLLNYFDKKGYTLRQGDTRIMGNNL
jgi:selenocysteine-specific elongation factor